MSSYSADEIIALLRRFGIERDRYVKALVRRGARSRTDFDALDYVEEAGELTPSALSERLLLTSGATTALIDRLEAAGLLTRRPHPNDRRSSLLRLTKQSDEAGSKQLAAYMNDLRAAARRFSASERAAIGSFLELAASTAAQHARSEPRSHAPRVTIDD